MPVEMTSAATWLASAHLPAGGMCRAARRQDTPGKIHDPVWMLFPVASGQAAHKLRLSTKARKRGRTTHVDLSPIAATSIMPERHPGCYVNSGGRSLKITSSPSTRSPTAKAVIRSQRVRGIEVSGLSRTERSKTLARRRSLRRQVFA